MTPAAGEAARLESLRRVGPAAMVDLMFAVEGEFLPDDYAVPLADALRGALPWLVNEPAVGVHPIRAARNPEGLVLSKRTRLKLRVPDALVARVSDELSGVSLAVAGYPLRVGEASPHPVGPYATLKAGIVVLPGTAGEAAFMAAMERELDRLGVVGEMICSKATSVGTGASRLEGFGVVIHDLSAKHSLALLTHGIGPGRHYGCGLFVHHKLIEGLDAYPE
jgi:CRISPR-associated protein Cas6